MSGLDTEVPPSNEGCFVDVDANFNEGRDTAMWDTQDDPYPGLDMCLDDIYQKVQERDTLGRDVLHYNPESNFDSPEEDDLNHNDPSIKSDDKDAEEDEQSSMFSHSTHSSVSRSAKRVRIDAVPLWKERDGDSEQQLKQGYYDSDLSKADSGLSSLEQGTECVFGEPPGVTAETTDTLWHHGGIHRSHHWFPSVQWVGTKKRRRRKRFGAFKYTQHTQLDLGRAELVRKYRLHVFVALIFLVTVLSVSLSWHYRNLATQMLHASQAIFFNPRTRQLTLTGSGTSRSISGQVGLDMPSWQLPLHCPIVMGNNPQAKECVWKNNAILRIVHFTEGERTRQSPVECYTVSWESLHPEHVPHDCFDISDDLWYGPSNMSESSYPIKGKFYFSPSNYTVGNNGVFTSVVDFYWLSAKGVGLRVNADDPVQVFWNQTGDNRLCILSNYTGPFYHQINHITAPHLNYTLCTGPDTLSTHSFMLNMHTSSARRRAQLPLSDLAGAYWSVRGHVGEREVNQSHVTKMAEKLQESGFDNIKIMLDTEWQATHGDLAFDPKRFPNITKMFDDLSRVDCRLTLCVSPYFQYSSRNFQKGVTEGKFVHDAGGRVTGLADSEFGLAAIADVTMPETRDWLTERLHLISRGDSESRNEAEAALSGEAPQDAMVHGFRLTYGRQEWLPYKPHFKLGAAATPNMFRRQMTETLNGVARPLIVEHTSDSRHVASLLPVQAKLYTIGDRRCLTGVIEKALTLGLMGYPFIMVDGIRAGNGRDIRPGELSGELYIRWLELATLFPAHQHPVTPWQFKDAEHTVAMAVNLTRQNEALKMAVQREEELVEEVSRGLPIVRPIWWNESTNQTAHAIETKDQFLLGSKFLVAPVLCEGVTSRDIHLPRGVWQDYHMSTLYVIGPATIRDHATPLGQTAVFKKVADTADMAGDTQDGAL